MLFRSLLEANRRLEDYNNLKNTNKDKQKEIKDDNDYFLESTIERANIQEQALKHLLKIKHIIVQAIIPFLTHMLLLVMIFPLILNN